MELMYVGLIIVKQFSYKWCFWCLKVFFVFGLLQLLDFFLFINFVLFTLFSCEILDRVYDSKKRQTNLL